jgi:hypothetical protein
MRTLALLIAFLSTSLVVPIEANTPDVFWLDKYGQLRWEDETARLDNFAIQLLNDPNYTGYIYIQVGHHSCSNEAVAHAVKARNYLMNVRHLPWDRVAFRDLGYADFFQVTLWLFPRGQPPRYVPDYQPATSAHVIQRCLQRKKRRQS